MKTKNTTVLKSMEQCKSTQRSNENTCLESILAHMKDELFGESKCPKH